MFLFFLMSSRGFNFFDYLSKFWSAQFPSNQCWVMLLINEEGCTTNAVSVFVFLLMELIQYHTRKLFIGLQNWEVSCCEFFILVRTTVLQQFHIKPIIIIAWLCRFKAKNQGNMWFSDARYNPKLPSQIDYL